MLPQTVYSALLKTEHLPSLFSWYSSGHHHWTKWLCSVALSPDPMSLVWHGKGSPLPEWNDISLALRICTAHPCILDIANYSPVNEGLTLHKVYPALHDANSRLTQFTNRRKHLLFFYTVKASVPRQTAKGEYYTYILLPHTALPSFGWRASPSAYNALVL